MASSSRLRDFEQTLYHGASPGRWARKKASLSELKFDAGCFLTPNPAIASMYCADWISRDAKMEFLQTAIEEVFLLGDPDELLAHGFVEVDDDGCLRRLPTATATHVVETWSALEIAHHLVGRSVRSLHHYPSGAVIFPFRLTTRRVMLIDCKGHHFDDLPGGLAGIHRARVSTDDVVAAYKGQTDAIWFMDLTDPAHATSTSPDDTVYVYSPRHLEFKLTGCPAGT